MKNIISSKSLFTLAIFLLLCAPISSIAQISPTIEWQRCIGGYSGEEVHRGIATRDGGSIIVSRSYSYDGDVHNASPNPYNGWVVKLNESGQIEWTRSFDGDNISSFTSVIETSDGNYIVAGGTRSLYVGGVRTHGKSDALVVKLNKNGEVIWQKAYGGTEADYLYSIAENTFEGGGYILAGHTSSNDGDVNGLHGVAGTDSSDAWIVKINSEGVIEWQECLGGSKIETATFILQTKEGGYAFTGLTSSNDGDIVGHMIDYETGWLVKLSQSGSIVWQKIFNTYFFQSDGSTQSVAKTIDGGLTVIGTSSNLDSTVQGFHKSKDLFGTTDIYVGHLNSSGTVLWERCYGGISDDIGSSICTTSDGGYLFIGTVQSNDGDVSGNHQSSDPFAFKGQDAWVVKLTSEGNVEWQHCYGGGANETGNSIIQSIDGKILFVGSATSIDGDVYGLHSIGGNLKNETDIWVVKLGTTADVPVSSNFDFTGLIRDKFLKIYPNPSSSSVHLEMLPWFTAKGVEIYNLLGIKISCETTLVENGANVNVRSLPNGTYIARVSYTTEKVNGTFTLPLIVYH